MPERSQRNVESCWISNWKRKKPGLTKGLTVSHLNEHFSAILTDPKYKLPSPKHTVLQDLEQFTEWHVFRMLDTIHPTAMGLDGIPDWFIRIAAAAVAKPITYLFNLSLNFSVVPSQWKASRIIPIPKITQPLITDLSPSPRYYLEKELPVVRSFLYPILLSPE